MGKTKERPKFVPVTAGIFFGFVETPATGATPASALHITVTACCTRDQGANVAYQGEFVQLKSLEPNKL